MTLSCEAGSPGAEEEEEEERDHKVASSCPHYYPLPAIIPSVRGALEKLRHRRRRDDYVIIISSQTDIEPQTKCIGAAAAGGSALQESILNAATER